MDSVDRGLTSERDPNRRPTTAPRINTVTEVTGERLYIGGRVVGVIIMEVTAAGGGPASP